METQVPQFCFRVRGENTSGKEWCFGNGILVDAEHGLFAVNKHFLDFGTEHFLLYPGTETKHRFVVRNNLVHPTADLALISIADPTVLPSVPLPVFGSPPAEHTAERLMIAGYQSTGPRQVALRFERYPHPDFFGYKTYVMCTMVALDEKMSGLSGSPLLNKEGKVLGIYAAHKSMLAYSIPSVEITHLLNKARRPSFKKLLKKLF